VAKHWGGDPAPPTFHTGSHELEMLDVNDRHRIIALAGRVLVGWPFRYVEACAEAHVWSAWAMVAPEEAPFAYSDMVKTYLTRANPAGSNYRDLVSAVEISNAFDAEPRESHSGRFGMDWSGDQCSRSVGDFFDLHLFGRMGPQYRDYRIAEARSSGDFARGRYGRKRRNIDAGGLGPPLIRRKFFGDQVDALEQSVDGALCLLELSKQSEPSRCDGWLHKGLVSYHPALPEHPRSHSVYVLDRPAGQIEGRGKILSKFVYAVIANLSGFHWI